MIAVALGILAIIVFAGDPAPVASTVAAAPAPVTAPDAGRLRDYQDRLRVLDERARQQLVTEPEPEPVPPLSGYAYDGAGGVGSTPDPLVEERKRREYESLFASNVVLSRRSEAERLTTGGSRPARPRAFGGWRATCRSVDRRSRRCSGPGHQSASTTDDDPTGIPGE